MRKKRIISVIFCAILVLSLAGCGNKDNSKDNNESKELYEYGLNIVNQIATKTNSREYAKMFVDDDSILKSSMMTTIRKIDYSNPDGIYEITVKKSVDEIKGIETEGIPEEVKPYIKDRVYTSIPSLLSGASGTDALVIASIYQSSYLFADKNIKEEDKIILYMYKDAYPIYVSFAFGDDGAILATGTLVINEKFSKLDESEIKGEFEKNLGNDIIDIKKIK